MFRAILVDDEKLALDELAYQLKRFEDIYVTGAFTNPVEALGQILLSKPEILFLDIEMPVMDGLNLAKIIACSIKNIEIAFVTAYVGHAIDAFEINAVDYVLKPISSDRLEKTIERIRSRHKSGAKTNRSIIEKLDNIDKQMRREEKFAVWDENGIFLLKAPEIRYVTIEKGVTQVISTLGRFNGKSGIEQWEEKLKDYGFFKCHRGGIVNMEYVERIIPFENNCCAIVLKGDKYEIPVSRSRTKELKKKLGI